MFGCTAISSVRKYAIIMPFGKCLCWRPMGEEVERTPKKKWEGRSNWNSAGGKEKKAHSAFVEASAFPVMDYNTCPAVLALALASPAPDQEAPASTADLVDPVYPALDLDLVLLDPDAGDRVVMGCKAFAEGAYIVGYLPSASASVFDW